VTLIRDDVTARLKDTEVSGSIGDEFNVDDAMATFLCLKGWAELTV